MRFSIEVGFERFSFDPLLDEEESAVVFVGIVDALHQLIRQSRQFVSQVFVAKNQFAALSLFENLEPNRLVLVDT